VLKKDEDGTNILDSKEDIPTRGAAILYVLSLDQLFFFLSWTVKKWIGFW
jgi:hypothetical protein